MAAQMTLERLKQLRYLRMLIQDQRERIENLEESLAPRSPVLSGMPHGSGANDRIGNTVPEIEDMRTAMMELVQQLETEEAEILSWISQAPPKVQLICRLRFLEGMRWNEVADSLDNGNGIITDGAVRMTLKNYLKRCSEGETQ